MNRRQAERLKARLEKSLTDLDIETKANHARYASASPNELDAINLENLRLVAERKKVEGEHALCMIRLQQIAANEKRAKQLGEERTRAKLVKKYSKKAPPCSCGFASILTPGLVQPRRSVGGFYFLDLTCLNPDLVHGRHRWNFILDPPAVTNQTTSTYAMPPIPLPNLGLSLAKPKLLQTRKFRAQTKAEAARERRLIDEARAREGV